MILRPGGLVLYKAQPAVVRGVADKKLTIELDDGQQVSVRPKDVALLHPGPLAHSRQLRAVSESTGEAVTAWELLDGGQTTLPELAELSFGNYTPETAWAAWRLVAEGLYFSGSPEAITVHSATRVAEIMAAREAKAAEERAWAGFLERAKNGRFLPEDERYLADVIALALEKSETSRVLRQLGRPQTREEAHAFLLTTGRWTAADNPYPLRLNVPTDQPDFPTNPLPDEPRRDLTHLVALAIDDAGSSDPDDALSYEDGRIWVHIADVAALVAPDSPADLEARNRAANLYLPEGTVRMLPTELTDLLALGLQPVSPALSFVFDATGDPELLEVTPSFIRVTRATYEEAETLLHESPYRELLALAERRRAARVANGAVEIELPEVKVKVREDGQVLIKPLPPLLSRDLVREAMLMVGEAIARLAIEHELPMPFTSQDPPGEVDAPGDGMAGMHAQRRVMQRGQQKTSPGRHAGLGLDAYVQATSPLRRYLDLVAHQQLRAYLCNGPLLDPADITLRIGIADAAGSAVRVAERLSNQHWTMVYLLQNPSWEGDGVVVEQKSGRDVVVLPDLAWEAELYRRRPRPLNSTVRLAIESVDLPNRTARFRALD